MRRPQNTKVAAQRLAQVMAHQPADDEDDEDDLYGFESAVPSVGIGLAGGKKTRNRSPTVRSLIVQMSYMKYFQRVIILHLLVAYLHQYVVKKTISGGWVGGFLR